MLGKGSDGFDDGLNFLVIRVYLLLSLLMQFVTWLMTVLMTFTKSYNLRTAIVTLLA